MEFPFNVTEILGNDFYVVDHSVTPCNGHDTGHTNLRKQTLDLCSVIDAIGFVSAKAQGLRGPITTAKRLRQSDHLFYVKVDPLANHGNGTVIGFVKIGVKNLYLYDKQGTRMLQSPMCVLDFYVHESVQRQGWGKVIFDFMLNKEGTKPHRLGYDRPSSEMMAFMWKHYGIKSTVPQSNSFVVYDGFFNPLETVLQKTDRSFQPSHDFLSGDSQTADKSLNIVIANINEIAASALSDNSGLGQNISFKVVLENMNGTTSSSLPVNQINSIVVENSGSEVAACQTLPVSQEGTNMNIENWNEGVSAPPPPAAKQVNINIKLNVVARDNGNGLTEQANKTSTSLLADRNNKTSTSSHPESNNKTSTSSLVEQANKTSVNSQHWKKSSGRLIWVECDNSKTSKNNDFLNYDLLSVLECSELCTRKFYSAATPFPHAVTDQSYCPICQIDSGEWNLAHV